MEATDLMLLLYPLMTAGHMRSCCCCWMYLQFAPYPKLLVDQEDADYTLAPALAVVHDLVFSNFRKYSAWSVLSTTKTVKLEWIIVRLWPQRRFDLILSFRALVMRCNSWKDLGTFTVEHRILLRICLIRVFGFCSWFYGVLLLHIQIYLSSVKRSCCSCGGSFQPLL